MVEEQKQGRRVKEAPAQPSQGGPKTTAKEGVRGIVRIVGKDVDGGLSVKDALPKVKGIGVNLAASLARAVEEQLGLDASAPIGSLTDQEIEQVEEVIKSPSKYGVPAFLLNRQRDEETGEPVHLVMSELVFGVKQDVQKEKDLRTWIGWRHSLGQKVRGQRNRTTGRTGMTVGVLKKAVKAMKAAAAASAQETGKK